MPYCRKCGTQLDDTARFCPVCGTAVTVAVAPAPPTPSLRARRARFPTFAIILIAILLAALVFGILTFLPFYPVNFNQTNNAPVQPGAEKLLLDFEADIARVNVVSQDLHGRMVVLNVTATGNVGIFGDPNNPVNVTFNRAPSNRTTTQIVTVKVTQTTPPPFAGNLQVVCDLYIDPSASLMLTVLVGTGEIVLNASAPVAFDSATLQVGTGNIEAIVADDAVIAGPFSMRTSTGSVGFQMNNADVDGNVSVSLQASTGSVDAFITENHRLGGNVTLSATTGTGGVALFMVLNDNAVASRIESQTSFGNIRLNVQNFAGNQSPIQSSNYPAASNFLVRLRTSLGDIGINARYEPLATPS